MSKLKINFNRPHISSEEIASRQNFDQVLSKAKPYLKPFYKKGWFLGSVVGVLALSGALVWQFNRTESEHAFVPSEEKQITVVASDNEGVKDSLKAEISKLDQEHEAVSQEMLDKTHVQEMETQGNSIHQSIDLPPSIPVAFPKQQTKKASLQAEKGGKYTFGKTIVYVPAYAFVDASGTRVKGAVQLEYLEFADAYDLLIGNQQMHYDSAGQRHQLLSTGMMEIKASQNGKALILDPKNPIGVVMGETARAKATNLYRFDTQTNNWVIRSGAWTTPEQLQSRFMPKQIMEKRTADFIVGESIDPKDFFKGKTFNNNQEPISAQKSLEPAKPRKASPQRYSFNIDVLPNEFPGIAEYKGMYFEVGEENKNFNAKLFEVNWNDVKIEQGTPGVNYLITFTTGQRYYTPGPKGQQGRYVESKDYAVHQFKVYPVYEKADSVKVMSVYKKKYEAYSQKLQEMEQKRTAEVKRMESVQQTSTQLYQAFTIDRLGVWNCDQIYRLPKKQTVVASYKDQSGNLVKPVQVQLLDRKVRSVFYYAGYGFSHLHFNPDSENLLVVQFGDGTWGYYTPAQFKQIGAEVREVDLHLHTVTQKFASAEELKTFMQKL